MSQGGDEFLCHASITVKLCVVVNIERTHVEFGSLGQEEDDALNRRDFIGLMIDHCVSNSNAGEKLLDF